MIARAVLQHQQNPLIPWWMDPFGAGRGAWAAHGLVRIDSGVLGGIHGGGLLGSMAGGASPEIHAGRVVAGVTLPAGRVAASRE